MTASNYDRDFYQWTRDQADLLRSGRLAALDVEHLVEELEGMGARERRELTNRLKVLIAHLLRWHCQTQLRSRSWDATDGRIDAAEGGTSHCPASPSWSPSPRSTSAPWKITSPSSCTAQAQVTVADLLARFPAEQGLGSVIGYLAIGVRKGVVSEGTEGVAWRGLDGVERAARIPRIFFVRAESHGADTGGRAHGTW